MGAFYVHVAAYGIPIGNTDGIKFKRLGVFTKFNRHDAFYRALTEPLDWEETSTNPGYQDYLQVWLEKAIAKHTSMLAEEYPSESQEFLNWLNSFSEKPIIVTIGEHEWESGLIT